MAEEFNWDDIEMDAGDREFVNLDETGYITLTFEQNTPKVRIDRKFDRPRYTFQVNGDKLFSTMSVRFMAALTPFVPLGGKTLTIRRTGEKYDTAFEVEEVSL